MKRLIVLSMMVLVAFSTMALARPHREWRDPYRGFGGISYGGYSRYDSYRYDSYGDSRCYTGGSLLSSLLGVPTFNDEEYWKYQNRVLDIGEKQLEKQEPEGTVYGIQLQSQDREIIRLRLEKKSLQGENAELKKQLAEMRKEVTEVKQMLQDIIKKQK